jgi:hypothetical protein
MCKGMNIFGAAHDKATLTRKLGIFGKVGPLVFGNEMILVA